MSGIDPTIGKNSGIDLVAEQARLEQLVKDRQAEEIRHAHARYNDEQS